MLLDWYHSNLAVLSNALSSSWHKHELCGWQREAVVTLGRGFPFINPFSTQINFWCVQCEAWMSHNSNHLWWIEWWSSCTLTSFSCALGHISLQHYIIRCLNAVTLIQVETSWWDFRLMRQILYLDTTWWPFISYIHGAIVSNVGSYQGPRKTSTMYMAAVGNKMWLYINMHMLLEW